MEINFPFSVILTWNPSISSFNSLKDVCDNVKGLSSCYGLKWEVTATIKTYKSIPQPNQSNQQQINLKKGKEQRTGVIFIQYDDSNITCVINSKDINQVNVEDILIADENIDSLLSSFSNLTLRATRKIQGFRYHLNNYIVSIGTVDNGPLAGILLLELSYIGTEFNSITTLTELHLLGERLIPLFDRNSIHFNLKSFIRSIEIETSFNISDRVLLWIDSLQLL